MNQRIFFLLAVGFYLFLSCNPMNQQSNLYEYRAGPSAARGYPAEVLGGSFLGGAVIPYGSILEATWGKSSEIVVVGDGRHTAPDTLRLNFFSYVDNRFYAVIHPLPQERLAELLSARYPETKDRTLSYYAFTVSIAPQGWVSVWLSGSAGRLEICSFRAEEINLDYETIFPNRRSSREDWVQIQIEEMYSFVQQDIAEGAVSSAYWENLSKQYRWKLAVNDPEFEVYDYSAELINVERRYHASNGNWLTESNEKAIPHELIFYLRHEKDPLRYKVLIELAAPWEAGLGREKAEGQTLQQMTRYRELMRIFEEFYLEVGDEEVSLMVEFDDAMQSAQVKLKTATKERIIEGCRIDGIFGSDRYIIND